MLVTDMNSPDFNSYASVADCRAYATARGFTLPADDTAVEPLMFQAMDWLEGRKWKGVPRVFGQNLSWPRAYVKRDYYTIHSDVIPKQVIEAQCRLAIEAQTIDLLASNQNGQEVLSEAVSGVVSVTYSEYSRDIAPSFPAVDALLRGLCVGTGQIAVVRG